jgi:hypothetical protein
MLGHLPLKNQSNNCSILQIIGKKQIVNRRGREWSRKSKSTKYTLICMFACMHDIDQSMHKEIESFALRLVFLFEQATIT